MHSETAQYLMRLLAIVSVFVFDFTVPYYLTTREQHNISNGVYSTYGDEKKRMIECKK